MAAMLFATAIQKNSPINLYNGGKMRRDFTYVDDIVTGILASLETPLGYQIINLGGANTVELEYFVSTLEHSMGKVAKKNYLPMQAGDVLQTSADISKAQKLLQWQPTVSLEDGIERFVTWFNHYYSENL